MNKEIEFLIEISPADKILDIHDLTGKVYQTFKEEITPVLQKAFLKIQDFAYKFTHDIGSYVLFPSNVFVWH